MALSKITRTSLNTGIDDNSDATAITIDSSENVGIGTTSPGAGVDVAYAGTAAAFRVYNSQATNPFGLLVDNTGADTSDSNYIADFRSGGTSRLRLLNSGNVLAGVTSSMGNGRLQVDATTDFVYCEVMRANATNGGFVLFQKDNGSTIGSISHNATNTIYLTTSDHRMKESVVDMTGAITRVKQLSPKRYNFISDPNDTTVDGFLAHEVQTVVPNAVSGTHNEVDDDGNAVMQGIDHSALVPLLTGALQEAIAKIETLETEMTALKARVTTLENA